MNLVKNLLDVVILITNSFDLHEKVLKLLFLLLELAVLDVEVEKLPDVVRAEFRLQVTHFVANDIRNVEVLHSNHL